MVDSNSVIRFIGRLCVFKDDALRRSFLEEVHRSRFSIQLGVINMYQDMKIVHWWIGMKKDAYFASKCQTWQLVKAQHQLPGGLLTLLDVHRWK